MIALLSPEIDQLESQIQDLQAKIQDLRATDELCAQAQELVQRALNKLGAFAPSQIWKFEDAIESLFTSDVELDDTAPDDDGGTHSPTPEPEPLPPAPDSSTSEDESDSESESGEPEQPPTYTQTTCADALETDQYAELVLLPSESVAYVKKRSTGEILATYAGFNSKQRATTGESI